MLPSASCGILIGAGAHGRVAAQIWHRADPARALAFLDDNPMLHGTNISGCNVYGSCDLLREPSERQHLAIIAIGNNETRMTLAQRLKSQLIFTNVIDPTAVVMPDVTLGSGILIAPNVVVQSQASIGSHVVINSGAIVEHDCIIQEGASVSPGVRMAGRVHIERAAFIATGATLVGRIRVGAGSIVAAGAVVTHDVPAGALVVGVPARRVRQVTDQDISRLF